jgi:hypothetical protein
LEHGTTLTSQFLLFVSCCMHAWYCSCNQSWFVVIIEKL